MTDSDTQNRELSAVRSKLDRIRSERARIATELRPLGAKLLELVRAAEQAKVAALIDATGGCADAVTKTRAALDAAVAHRDELEEAERLLAAEASTVSAAIARLEAGPARARIEAVKAKLRARIERGAKDFRTYVVDCIALDRLESRIPHGFADDKALEHAARSAGTSAESLNDEGRAFGSALLAGRTEV